jgi:hypothetical protein
MHMPVAEHFLLEYSERCGNMNRILLLCAPTVIFLIASGSPAQSLGELAKKEKERREQIQSGVRVITNKEAAKFNSGPVTTVSLPPAQAPEKETPEKAVSPPVKPASDEPVDFQGRPESWWRQTMADARKTLKDLGNEGNVLTLKLADLQNQFYRESDGFKQQQIQREIQKTLYEQDRNKEDFEKAKKGLEDLEKEARKSGALPGWLNPKTP